MHLQGLHRRRGHVVRPQVLDEPVARDDLGRVQREVGDQRGLPAGGDRDHPAADPNLEGAGHPALDVAVVAHAPLPRRYPRAGFTAMGAVPLPPCPKVLSTGRMGRPTTPERSAQCAATAVTVSPGPPSPPLSSAGPPRRPPPPRSRSTCAPPTRATRPSPRAPC